MIESGSSLQAFNDCPRKYQYKYIKLLDSGGYSSALTLGSLVHASIEEWSGRGRANATREELISIQERLADSSVVNNDLIKARGIYAQWHKFWDGDYAFSNKAWEWIHSEKEFSFHVNADGDRHAGKIDGIIRHKEWNKVFVYELKTATAREKDSYIHRLQVDRQVSANIYAAQEMGFHVDGVLYDICWKPAIRARKDETEEALAERFVATIAETPAEYFHREIVYRKDADIQDHLYDVQAQFRALEHAHTEGNFYRNSGACDSYGKLCPFFSACMERGNLDMESMYRKRDRKHPELSKEIQDENSVHV